MLTQVDASVLRQANKKAPKLTEVLSQASSSLVAPFLSFVVRMPHVQLPERRIRGKARLSACVVPSCREAPCARQ
jgi:hypothetical protein